MQRFEAQVAFVVATMAVLGLATVERSWAGHAAAPSQATPSASDRQWVQSVQAGYKAYRKGDYEGSIKHYSKALELAESFGAKDSRLSDSLYDLGVAYQAEGKLAKAEEQYKLAIENIDTELNSQHSELANLLENYAVILRRQDRDVDAEPLLRRLVAIQKKTLKPQDPALSASLAELGSTLAAVGKFAEAQTAYEQAIEIKEQTIGKDNPDLAHVLHSYSKVLKRLGKEKEAAKVRQRAHELRQKQDIWWMVIAGTVFTLIFLRGVLLVTRARGEMMQALQGKQQFGGPFAHNLETPDDASAAPKIIEDA